MAATVHFYSMRNDYSQVNVGDDEQVPRQSAGYLDLDFKSPCQDNDRVSAKLPAFFLFRRTAMMTSILCIVVAILVIIFASLSTFGYYYFPGFSVLVGILGIVTLYIENKYAALGTCVGLAFCVVIYLFTAIISLAFLGYAGNHPFLHTVWWLLDLILTVAMMFLMVIGCYVFWRYFKTYGTAVNMERINGPSKTPSGESTPAEKKEDKENKPASGEDEKPASGEEQK